MRPRIVVVGSINLDLVARSPRFPAPGETVMGGPFEQHPGGKGANQAVAAARLGAAVSMVGCVGDDDTGRMLLAGLRAEGIDTTHVRITPNVATGVALITVNDRTGENTIVVAPGANARLSPGDVIAARESIRRAELLLTQLETPIDAAHAAIDLASEGDAILMLNAAPARPLEKALLARFNLLVVNEDEARALAGGHALSSPETVLAALPLSPRAVAIITRGPHGAIARGGAGPILSHDAFPVSAIDTTGAGDAFCGAVAVRLAEIQRERSASQHDIRDTVRFGCAAAALACARHGAQPSLPTRREVENLLQSKESKP